MSLSILTVNPIAYHAYTPVQQVSVIAYAGGRAEQRAELEDREYRDYEVVYRCNASTRATLDAFFRALDWTKTSFLWRVPVGLANHEDTCHLIQGQQWMKGEPFEHTPRRRVQPVGSAYRGGI